MPKLPDHGGDWTIGISTRSPRVALAALISGAALLGGVAFDFMHGIPLFDAASGDDLAGTLFRRLAPVLLVASAALLGYAAYWFWGRYTVSASGAAGKRFQGSRRNRKRPEFSPACN
ncbi:MAG: hypothetical protein LAP87_08360 [Acidobacteriia bacterium]|nr:hypothetical protein [Terriglobia bacterium]